MVAVGAVTGLIYLFCHFVSLKLCSDWLFWHYSDHISVYISKPKVPGSSSAASYVER